MTKRNVGKSHKRSINDIRKTVGIRLRQKTQDLKQEEEKLRLKMSSNLYDYMALKSEDVPVNP